MTNTIPTGLITDFEVGLVDEPQLLMTKNHFKLAINGLRMKTEIRIAMYYVLVEGLSQTAVAGAIGREPSFISDRAKVIKQRFKKMLKEKGYTYGEYIFPEKMNHGLQEIEESLLNGDVESSGIVDAVSEATQQKNIESILHLKSLVKVNELKKNNQTQELTELLNNIGIENPQELSELNGLESLLKLIALVKSQAENDADDNIDLDDLI